MNLDKHIASLLYEHDCVIIPEFGGFVCNVSPASVQSGRFEPPFKKISFNRNLKNNDGLLANHISQEERISYADAVQAISGYVSGINAAIGDTGRFELKKIGTFCRGEENTLLFEQNKEINYLPEAFGYSSFFSPAIKREPIERKIEKQLKDKVAVVTAKEEKKPGSKIYKRRYVVSVSLLLATVFVFISLSGNLWKTMNVASLNPFAHDPEALYQPSEYALPGPDLTKDNVSDLLASNPRRDTMRYLNIMINGSIPIVVSLEKNDPAAIKSAGAAKRKSSGSSGKFHIIGGAFAVYENAEKFRKKLEQLGYNAVILDRKLQLVSYGGFATREEALKALENIRALQQDVWLMSN